MGYAILNRLIGLVSKTLKISFFFFTKTFIFTTLVGFWINDAQKTDLIEGRQQFYWYPETLLYAICYITVF